MLTEDEAKKKWCPMVRAGNEAGCNRNESDASGRLDRCIASECMMWQWLPKTHYREMELWSKSKNTKVNSAHSDDADWRPIYGEKSDEPPPAVGYCGLMQRMPG